MNSNEMFGGAVWIDCPGSEAPIFARSFIAVKGERAEITICGLGYFKLFINGKRVSSDLLVPCASNYSERDLSKFSYPLKDEMYFRTYVLKYDISDYLLDGENSLGIMLGCGYYCQEHRFVEGYVSFGYPKLNYIIRKASGDILCGGDTLCHKGFITENSLYDGEKQDYTLLPEGFGTVKCDYSAFCPSREITAPESDYCLQTMPADKVIASLEPTLIEEKDGVRLYDAGVNTVGWAVITCNNRGEKIKVSYAEDIYDKPNYGLHFAENYQTEEFITDGTEREYIPHFTWHGFRYFKVEGAGEVKRIDVVHADCPVSSSFESDNEQLNNLYNIYVHTQLCNMHSGVPSDCPHRERLGYTGDGQLCCEAAMLTLDAQSFYRKWITDILDCRCRKTGHVQHTAPCMGGGGGPVGWGGAIVEVPYTFWKIYGDTAALEEAFPAMLRFFDYLQSRSENGLIVREEKDGWCLGDWCSPERMSIPEPFVNTCLAINLIDKTFEIASVLGREGEAKHLEALKEEYTEGVKRTYLNKDGRGYVGDLQGSTSIALRAGLGTDEMVNAVIEKYTRLGMYDTGIIATETLTGELFDRGGGQLAFDLMAGTGRVSFDYMFRNGGTTLWENWSGCDSKNHPMFGAVTKYIFTRLLGIRQKKSSAGFTDVVISPCFVNGLDRASGKIGTVNGDISVSFVKNNGKVAVTVSAASAIRAKFVYGNIERAINGTETIEISL